MLFEGMYIPPAKRQRWFPLWVRLVLMFLGCLGVVALLCVGAVEFDAIYRHGL